jgi:hypothetical protein
MKTKATGVSEIKKKKKKKMKTKATGISEIKNQKKKKKKKKLTKLVLHGNVTRAWTPLFVVFSFFLLTQDYVQNGAQFPPISKL